MISAEQLGTLGKALGPEVCYRDGNKMVQWCSNFEQRHSWGIIMHNLLCLCLWISESICLQMCTTKERVPRLNRRRARRRKTPMFTLQQLLHVELIICYGHPSLLSVASPFRETLEKKYFKWILRTKIAYKDCKSELYKDCVHRLSSILSWFELVALNKNPRKSELTDFFFNILNFELHVA